MNDARLVFVDCGHVCITISYRTGHTELRINRRDLMPPGGACVVRHVGPASMWGTFEVSAVLPAPTHVPLRWRLAAVPAVAMTAAVKVFGSRGGRFSRLVRLACLGRALRPAPTADVRQAIRAVRCTSSLIPARWACLEQSTAASVLLAMTGHRAEWRHGIATDPVRLHAWIADHDGHPVEEPTDIVHYTATCTPDGPGPAPTRSSEGKTST